MTFRPPHYIPQSATPSNVVSLGSGDLHDASQSAYARSFAITVGASTTLTFTCYPQQSLYDASMTSNPKDKGDDVMMLCRAGGGGGRGRG